MHFLDIGLPVEDGSIEGEGRLIIRVQRPGQSKGVVIHKVQLRLRVLLVERVIPPQEIQAYAGPVQVSASEKESVPISPILSGIAVIGGIALIAVGARGKA